MRAFQVLKDAASFWRMALTRHPTAEQFTVRYAIDSGVTVQWLREHGRSDAMRDWLSPLWITIDEATGRPPGLQHFTLTGEVVLRRCGTCDATYPQTDEGWRELQDHEFEAHERPIHYEWAELDGLEVRLQLVRRKEPERAHSFAPPGGHTRVELMAVTSDGTCYFFPFDGYEVRDDYHGSGKMGYFKVKPRARVQRLLGAGS